MGSRDHKAPWYVVFSIPLLPSPSWGQISFSAPYSRTSSAYGPPIDSQIAFLLHGVGPTWEATQFWASQEIPRIVLNPKVHSRIDKCPPPVPILSQIDPVLTSTSHFLKVNHNIIISYSLPAAEREQSLHTLLKFHIPNLMSIFRFLCRHNNPIDSIKT